MRNLPIPPHPHWFFGVIIRCPWGMVSGCRNSLFTIPLCWFFSHILWWALAKCAVIKEFGASAYHAQWALNNFSSPLLTQGRCCAILTFQKCFEWNSSPKCRNGWFRWCTTPCTVQKCASRPLVPPPPMFSIPSPLLLSLSLCFPHPPSLFFLPIFFKIK